VRFVLIILAALVAGVTAVQADDWTAVRLRGLVLELIDGQWEQLARGAVVSDDRVIRTVNGRVTFVRGAETIELGPNTQVQIFDQPRTRPYTTVRQYFGQVAIEAEVRDVQHFAVQTPYMVAAVKGTRFTVLSDEDSSEVRVQRGAVGVESTGDGSHSLIVAGQSASAGEGQRLAVAGRGDLPDVLGPNGKPVKEGVEEVGVLERIFGKKEDEDEAKDNKGKKGKSGNNSGQGSNGNGNGGNGNGNGNGQGHG
jgi:ferric-dicitrate binding protein FerR (iron transport regulator)